MTCTIHWLLICSYGGFPFGIVRYNMLDQLITNSLKLKWYKSLILPLFLRWTFAKIMRFFGTKKTNEKTLIKKVVFGANLPVVLWGFRKILHSISYDVMPVSILLVAPPRLNTEWLILIAGEKKIIPVSKLIFFSPSIWLNFIARVYNNGH